MGHSSAPTPEITGGQQTPPHSEVDLAERHLPPPVVINDLGDMACVRSRSVVINGEEHIRRTWTVESDKYTGNIRVTAPLKDTDNANPVDTIVHIPGFTEMIDAGTAKRLHEELAVVFPDRQILSIGTDGVSKYGPCLQAGKALTKDFHEMAAARLALMRHFANGGESSLLGISMGSVLAMNMAHQNIGLRATRQANIDRILLTSSAVVDPAHARKVMLTNFVLHMFVDAPRKAFKHPREAAQVAKVMGGVRFGLFSALGGNIINLVKGTPVEVVEAVLDHYRMDVIDGETDPLARLDDWRRHQLRTPNGLGLTVLRGEGHAFTLDARTAAGVIRDTVDANVISALA